MKSKCLSLVLACAIYLVQHAEGARILGLFALQGNSTLCNKAWKRAFFMPVLGKSHFVMFQEVMKGLADAGHQVDVVSHFPQKKPYPNYTDIVDLSGTLPAVLNNLTYELVQNFGRGSLEIAVEMAGNQPCRLMELPGLQRLIKSPPTDPPYDLVIVEYFLANCYLAFGRHLKVPVVAISSSSIMPRVLGNPFNTAVVSELPDRSVSPMNFFQRFKNTFFVLYVKENIKSYLKPQNDMMKKYFGPDMPDLEQLERELSLFLVNSHPIFHGVRPMTPAIVEVSGLHVRDDNTPIPAELKKWLDDSKSGFIFFSLGSMVKIESFPKAALAEIYAALAKVAPIRILMKVAVPEDLPPGLPDNVRTLTWAPQVQVLKHKNIRGFLTHGGLMGLQEAVTFAVPLIGMPLFGDQVSSIHILVERGIAVSLDYKNLKKDEIVAAINAVVHDPKYKNNMNAISKQFLDRPRSARDTAVFWIEYILRHGGDSLRSPAVYLTWWQVALLDVYGSVIAAVLIVLYVLKLLISTILGRIFYTNTSLAASKKRN